MNSDPLPLIEYQKQEPEKNEIDFEKEYENISECIYDVFLTQLNDHTGNENANEKQEELKNCALCDFKCPADKINAHYFVHLLDGFENFECPDCAELFEDLDVFINHVDQHDQNRMSQESQTLFQEQEIDKQIDEFDLDMNPPFDLALLDLDRKQTKVEMETVKQIEEELAAIAPAGDSPSMSSDSNDFDLSVEPPAACSLSVKCSHCDRSFSNKESLAEHTKIHQKFQCELCQKSFVLESTLNSHLKKHKGSNLNYCDICNVPYSEKSDLKVHFKKAHSNLREFQCSHENCNKFFKSAGDLKSHAKIHSNERSFKCDLCSKTFNHLTSLRNHKSVHSGERNYQCQFCSKMFSFNGNLKVHIRSMHTKERSFECNVCGKTFARSSNLQEHSNIHKGIRPYKCQELVDGVMCNKSFSNSSTLAKHKRIHFNIRNFKCLICEKSFIQMTHLKKHQKTHTQEKSHECQHCQKRFQRSDTLKKHISNVHGNVAKKTITSKPIKQSSRP